MRTLKQGESSKLSYEINMLLRCLNYILVIKNVISNKYIILLFSKHFTRPYIDNFRRFWCFNFTDFLLAVMVSPHDWNTATSLAETSSRCDKVICD